MKLKLIVLFCCLSFIQTALPQRETRIAHSPAMNYFSLSDVQLLDGNFKHIQDLTHDYLLTIEPDRLCSWFRREAGLTPKAQPYPGWESDKGYIIPGHIMGFYLSSMSMMYETTGDTRIIERLTYTLNELDECQNAAGDGYLAAVQNGRHAFEAVLEGGDYRVDIGSIDGKGEPVYIMNKIMLGLYGVYTRCNLPVAKKIITDMADWFGRSVLDKLNEDGVQRMLICEHGSISESFAYVYELTGDKKYLSWAERLNDRRMLIPASEGRDILEGHHANCQIQKFTGIAHVYRYTNDAKYADAARFFWDTVVANHTWIMGGNSTGEHFFNKSEYEQRVQRNGGPEACNSVNMLRLTEALYQDFPKPEMIDYYERVLINHLLGAYEPESGMIAYMIKLQPGGFKTHSTKYNSFWCCTGTGFESPAKFQKMIYTHDDASVYVNLFIPSVLNWKEKGITLRQTTAIPNEETTSLEVKLSEPKEFSLKIRHPHWVKKGALKITVNGRRVKTSSSPSQFAEVKRTWKDGDKVVVHLPMHLNVVPLTESDKFVAFTYGPVVLAAELETNDMERSDFFDEHDNWAGRISVEQRVPIDDLSWLTGTSADIAWKTRRQSASRLTFKTDGVGNLYDYTLVPFNSIHFSRYMVYFPYAKDEKALAEIDKRQQERKELKVRTIDHINVAHDDSEKAHKMEAFSTQWQNGEYASCRFGSLGGYITYNMRVLPNEKNTLHLSYMKDNYDKQHFDILVDGKVVATFSEEHLENLRLWLTVPIPEELTKGKSSVTVKFQAKRERYTARLIDLRMLKEAK